LEDLLIPIIGRHAFIEILFPKQKCSSMPSAGDEVDPRECRCHGRYS